MEKTVGERAQRGNLISQTKSVHIQSCDNPVTLVCHAGHVLAALVNKRQRSIN